MHRRQRDLGGRDEVERAAGLRLDRLEQLLLELRQLGRREHRLRAHEVRDPDLLVAVRLGVEVEHELGERPLEPGAEPPQHREAGLRELRASLEVEDPQPLAELPVRAGREREGPRLAPAAHLDVVVRGGAGRHRRVRADSGSGAPARRGPSRAARSSASSVRISSPTLPGLLDRGGRVAAPALRLRDRLGRPVPPRAAARRASGRAPRRRASTARDSSSGTLRRPGAEPGLDDLRALPEEPGVKHRWPAPPPPAPGSRRDRPPRRRSPGRPRCCGPGRTRPGRRSGSACPWSSRAGCRRPRAPG